MNLPPSAYKLAQALAALPGIGPKQANKLVVYLVGYNRSVAEQLSNQIEQTLAKVQVCKQCGNLAEESLCGICQDSSRDRHQILVVENVLDLLAMEAAGIYQGLYCVIGKLLSPINGILANDLHTEFLLQKEIETKEVIFALPANVEGEMTTGFIQSQLVQRYGGNIKFTKLARGISRGISMEYTDPDTLSNAFINRV